MVAVGEDLEVAVPVATDILPAAILPTNPIHLIPLVITPIMGTPMATLHMRAIHRIIRPTRICMTETEKESTKVPIPIRCIRTHTTGTP